jgi:uncharacterized membrane protein
MTALLPSPLHPLVVHFPVVLAVFLPFLALLAMIAIARGTPPRTAWGLVTVAAVLLFIGSHVAIWSGEQEEEKVEEVLDHDLIEEHEHHGERLRLMAGIAVVVFAIGMGGGGFGRIARPVGFLLSVAILIQSIPAGHSGAMLVYRHGAAAAYVEQPAGPAGAAGATGATAPATPAEPAARTDSALPERDD